MAGGIIKQEKKLIKRNRGKYPLLELSQRCENVDDNWTEGLKPYERLYQHQTISSALWQAKNKIPIQAPKDELDFVLDAVYSPLKTLFADKGDVYLQHETVYGEDPNYQTWRMLRNVRLITPSKAIENPIVFGGVPERESIHHVKLGIASYHSPQTNPGYSRTPSGAFYGV